MYLIINAIFLLFLIIIKNFRKNMGNKYQYKDMKETEGGNVIWFKNLCKIFSFFFFFLKIQLLSKNMLTEHCPFISFSFV